MDGALGHFQSTGDRVTFYTSDGRFRFLGLENLALERVARVVSHSSDPGDLMWIVSGVITEFRGTNYLMIRRAALSENSSVETADQGR